LRREDRRSRGEFGMGSLGLIVVANPRYLTTT